MKITKQTKQKARLAVYQAVLRGNLPPITEQVCVDCGDIADDYHHTSYEEENWINVIPLCRTCHSSRHDNNRSKGGRPPLPPELKRVRCGWLTIPQWMADWLKEQDQHAGHIIEEALIEKYGLEPPVEGHCPPNNSYKD